jgi:hypothetical protein
MSTQWIELSFVNSHIQALENLFNFRTLPRFALYVLERNLYVDRSSVGMKVPTAVI